MFTCVLRNFHETVYNLCTGMLNVVALFCKACILDITILSVCKIIYSKMCCGHACRMLRNIKQYNMKEAWNGIIGHFDV